MSYKNIYYKQYQKKKDELHQLILDEFKKAKAKMKNFEFAKKVILERLADLESKTINGKDENIKFLLSAYSSKTEYQKGSEDLVFENELKDEYNKLKERLSLSSYNSFLKALADYYVTRDIRLYFDSYWSNLRSMFRLNKFEGFDSFKKFDLIQLRKDGNQAISKELNAVERLKIRNPEFSTEELIILNQNPEGIQVENKKTNQKLNPAKFKIEPEYIHVFEQESFYNYISAHFLEDNISFSDFKTFFIYGKVLNKEIKFTENNFYATRLLYTLKEFFKKFEIKHIMENQIVKNDLGKRLNEQDISQAKSRYKFKKINDLEGKILKIISYK